MSASNGGLPSERNLTVFTLSSARFRLAENRKIKTEEFLEASKGVVLIVGKYISNLPRQTWHSKTFRKVWKSVCPSQAWHERQYNRKYLIAIDFLLLLSNLAEDTAKIQWRCQPLPIFGRYALHWKGPRCFSGYRCFTMAKEGITFHCLLLYCYTRRQWTERQLGTAFKISLFRIFGEISRLDG